MKTVYLDLVSGISGDMFLGAMLDLGVSFADLQQALLALHLPGYHLHADRGTKGTISGIKLDVHTEAADEDHEAHAHLHHRDHEHSGGHHHHHEPERDYPAIQRLIRDSGLNSWVKERALAVFARVAEAEAKVHGIPADQVHFHEVGAIDSIVDIVGACIALDLLGRPKVLASVVTDGTGWMECAHGRFPIPAPATLEILAARRVAIAQCAEPHELVTPTGAAILAEFAESFGPMPMLKPMRVGYGIGTRENRTRPNVLRAILAEGTGSLEPSSYDWEVDSVSVLETNLDDVTAEMLGDFVSRALAAGALDVYYTPVQMKKNRPGTLLSILCRPDQAEQFAELILRETTAFGVRSALWNRWKLQRRFSSVNTEFGEVTVKIGTLSGDVVQASPEYEACRHIAEQAGVPVRRVFEAAIHAIRNHASL